MNVTEFKQRLAECRSRGDIEIMMGHWSRLHATFWELVELRRAVEAKLEAITDDGCPGALGGAFVPAGDLGVAA